MKKSIFKTRSFYIIGIILFLFYTSADGFLASNLLDESKDGDLSQ